jgi:hypothetical protein
LSAAPSPFETIEVRTSPAEVVIPLLLGGVGLAGVAASVDYMGPRQRLITFAVFAALLVGVGAARLAYRGPRLVISAERVGWREAGQKDLRHVAWSQIQSARLEPAFHQTPLRLRLVLTSSSALEIVASDDQRRYVDIPIDGITLSPASLKLFIHQAAPHLFAPSA